MAKKQIVQLIDDLDGSELDERGENVTFGLDGRTYEIDLSTTHAEELRTALAPYVRAGRQVGRQPQRRASGSEGRRDLATIRAWANAQGYDVSQRGRVPAKVIEAYDAAN